MIAFGIVSLSKTLFFNKSNSVIGIRPYLSIFFLAKYDLSRPNWRGFPNLCLCDEELVAVEKFVVVGLGRAYMKSCWMLKLNHLSQ